MSVFKRIGTFLADALETIVVAGSIFAIVYLFLLQPHQVIGDSMAPNFHNNEYVLTDKISYRLRNPQRGEVIVFRSPTNIEKDFIKRIVALPHETVRLTDGKVFVNNEVLDEGKYLSKDTKTFPGSFTRESAEHKVPADAFFVLGDNRTNSQDSREFGFVAKGGIIGRSFFVYWPIDSMRLVKLDEAF